MHRLSMLTLAIVIAMLMSVPAEAGIGGVTVSDNDFTPATLSGTLGGNVVWDWAPSVYNTHNVRQNKRLFRSGDPTSNPNTIFIRTPSAGNYPYYCEIHGSAVMNGVIRISPIVGQAPSGLPFTVVWASSGTNTGNAFDVQYRVGSGDWTTWKTDTTAFSDIFGDGDDPVVVQSGVTYRIRARSQKSVTATGKVSKYSPAVAFTP